MMRKISMSLTATALAAMSLSSCSSNSQASTPTPTKTVTVQASRAYDTSDLPTLAGFSNRIFVGTVTKNLDKKKFLNAPAMRWQVKVDETLKGELAQSVDVTQQSGIDGDSFVLMEGDPLLVPGKSYLFAGRYNQETKSVVLVSVNGDVPVTGVDDEKVSLMRAAVKSPKKVTVPDS